MSEGYENTSGGFEITTYNNVSATANATAILATKTLSKGVYIVEGRCDIEANDMRYVITINTYDNGSTIVATQHRSSAYDNGGWVFPCITALIKVDNTTKVELTVIIGKTNTVKNIRLTTVRIA